MLRRSEWDLDTERRIIHIAGGVEMEHDVLFDTKYYGPEAWKEWILITEGVAAALVADAEALVSDLEAWTRAPLCQHSVRQNRVA